MPGALVKIQVLVFQIRNPWPGPVCKIGLRPNWNDGTLEKWVWDTGLLG
jgi:hypothetical protein